MPATDVQMLGLAKSQVTRKAQRYFSERRVDFHYHDLAKRAPTPGQLRTWVQRFGVEGVLDPESKAYQEQGLRYVSAGQDDWLARMAANPAVLRLPLLRCGTELAVGDDPDGWARVVAAAQGTA